MSLIILFVIIAFLAQCYSPDIKIQKIKDKWFSPTSAFLNINNLNIHYTDAGDKTAPVAIMLHGLSSSFFTWHKISNKMSHQYRVITLDLPGFGLTGPWPNSTDYSAQNYSHYIELFVKALNIQTYSLIGNSFGGEIAWRLAKQHPTNVDKLILINATCHPAPFKNRLLGWQIAAVSTPQFLHRIFYLKCLLNTVLKSVLHPAHILVKR
jgi:pimeloyl-ACP methyl ester carboxylesterase